MRCASIDKQRDTSRIYSIERRTCVNPCCCRCLRGRNYGLHFASGSTRGARIQRCGLNQNNAKTSCSLVAVLATGKLHCSSPRRRLIAVVSSIQLGAACGRTSTRAQNAALPPPPRVDTAQMPRRRARVSLLLKAARSGRPRQYRVMRSACQRASNEQSNEMVRGRRICAQHFTTE